MANQLSSSQRTQDGIGGNAVHRKLFSDGVSAAAKALDARRSAEAAAARPSVISSTSPSSRRSNGSDRGDEGGDEGGDDLAARETSRRPPGVARLPANHAAPHASR